MNTELPLEEQLLTYKFKLQLAKALIVFVSICLLFVIVIAGFLLHYTNAVQLQLGKAIGITDTLQILTNSCSQSSPVQIQ